MGDIYFWRQVFILFTTLLTAFSTGVIASFPAVLYPALTDQNSTDIRTTGNHATWIGAIHGFGGIFGSLALSPIMQRFGRKAAQHGLSIPLAIGWITLSFAQDITTIYIGRIIQGLSAGAIYINSILVAEYVNPTRRGYFIALKKVTVSLGTLWCHAMGTVWTWRQIALFTAMPAILSSLMTCFWPESPPFLALRGRYSDCTTSFKWLNGNSKESQKELKSLIEAQTQHTNSGVGSCFKEVAMAFRKKEVRKAFLLSFLLTVSIDLSGRYYLMAYLVQVMKEILGNDPAAIYFTLGTDTVSVIALASSTIVIRYFNRRTVFFSTGAFSTILMLLISILIYLKTIYSFSKFSVGFTALVLVLQCFMVNIGIAPVSFAIFGEIFPLEHRGLGACISGAFFMLLYSVTMKLIPLLMSHAELYGTFAVLGVLSAICCGVLYKVLPETKDKTLQDIEYEIKGVYKIDLDAIENSRLMR